MCRKSPGLAAPAAIRLVMLSFLAAQLALPGVAAASSLPPPPTSLVGIAGGDEEDPPPPTPDPNPLPPGVLWVDDFEDGTTDGWVVGQQSPFQPRVVSGGQRGADDHYLRMHAGGDSNLPGSRVVVLNRNPLWTQDLNSRGVKAIELDFLALNSFTPFQLRFAFYTLGPNGFASTNPVTIVSDGKWHHVVFPFTEAAMTNLGTMAWADVLKHFEEVRILSSPTPSLRGEANFADWGFDNIRVVAAPEPSAGVIVLVGVGFAMLRRRTRSTDRRSCPLQRAATRA